jgi:hypothetical protein
MIRRAWVFAALVACKPISAAPESPAPVNACGGTTGFTCGGFPTDAGVECLPTGDAGTCEPGAPGPCTCQVGASVNPVDPSVVLVVDVPPLAPYGGGSTYAIQLADVLDVSPLSPNACTDYPLGAANSLCFIVSDLETAAGAYEIAYEQAKAAGRYLGPPGSAITLPVSATFIPQWTPPLGVPTDARLLNLPLPPVFASVGCKVAVTDILLSENGYSPICDGFPFEWVAALPPAGGPSQYVGVVQVAAPFNDAFPDLSYPVTANPATLGVELGLVSTSSSTSTLASILQWPAGSAHGAPAIPLVVKRADGGAFGPGWTAYLRDPATLRAITSRAPLEGDAPSVLLNYISTQAPVAFDLLIEPPPGASGVPRFLVGADQIVEQGTEVLETYPALPPEVHASGTVAGPAGDAVSATLLFFSTGIADVASCMAGTPANQSLQLSYQALVQTDDQLSTTGSVGHFSVDLPQGNYSVVVEPGPTSTYAKSVNGQVVVALDPPVCSGPSPSLDGLGVEAHPPLTVLGAFVTADGRPLADANVDFTPAAALAATRFNPTGTAGSEELPCPPDDCTEVWPRSFTTTTGLDGKFRIDVDPGLPYDVTVRPEDGTGWPWLVRPDHFYQGNPAVDGGAAVAAVVAGFEPTTLTMEPITVPAPYVLSLVLLDPNQNPLSGASVEAYAFSSGVALNIGQAVADANGHFTMMLTTAFPTN